MIEVLAMKISAIYIAKNEAENIARSLESVKDSVDELTQDHLTIRLRYLKAMEAGYIISLGRMIFQHQGIWHYPRLQGIG